MGPDLPEDPKRRRILEAALEVCEKSGVHAARMEEVAARAQVSKGTLYRYFESKEDLFLATIIANYERGLQGIDPARRAGADPRERLAQVFEGLVAVLMDVSPVATVHYQAWGVVAGVPQAEARLNRFLRDFHAARDQEFRELIEAGQAAGQFRSDVAADTVSAGISALLSGFIYRSAFDPSGASPDGLRDCFDALVRRSLEPSLAVRPHGERGGDG